MSRHQITLSEKLAKRARAIKNLRAIGGDGYSELLQVLIREEYERLKPPVLSREEVKSAETQDGGKVKPRPKKHVNSSEDAAASPIERSVLAAIEREGKRATRER
jgi:hypothetical protein